MGGLFRPDTYITGEAGAGNNWAKGCTCHNTLLTKTDIPTWDITGKALELCNFSPSVLTLGIIIGVYVIMGQGLYTPTITSRLETIAGNDFMVKSVAQDVNRLG